MVLASFSGHGNQKNYASLKDDQEFKHSPPVLPLRKKPGE